MNGMLCHVCGSPDIFEVHTVYMVKNPAVMVNIGYCKKCGEYINTTEQALHRYNMHKKYEETEKMETKTYTFGDAIELAKQGHKIARKGWNGKGMYVYLVKGRTVPADDWKANTPAQELTGKEVVAGEVTLLDHFDMYTTNSEGRRARLCGWLASQTDMLSDDWIVVD